MLFSSIGILIKKKQYAKEKVIKVNEVLIFSNLKQATIYVHQMCISMFTTKKENAKMVYSLMLEIIPI